MYLLLYDHVKETHVNSRLLYHCVTDIVEDVKNALDSECTTNAAKGRNSHTYVCLLPILTHAHKRLLNRA